MLVNFISKNSSLLIISYHIMFFIWNCVSVKEVHFSSCIQKQMFENFGLCLKCVLIAIKYQVNSCLKITTLISIRRLPLSTLNHFIKFSQIITDYIFFQPHYSCYLAAQFHHVSFFSRIRSNTNHDRQW